MHSSSKPPQANHRDPSRGRTVRAALYLCIAVSLPTAGLAQQQQQAPAVGVVQVERRPITTSFDFVGRIEAIGKVDLRARVTGVLQGRSFEEGTEVTENQALFRIEPAQFEADVERRKADLASAQATHENAKIQLGRARELARTQAGPQARVDDALAAERQADAQVQSAQAALRQAEISLGYTDIRAPLAGKIGRSVFTVGAVVGPDSGTLATIVSQDPMRVAFPISVREGFAMRDRLGAGAGPADVQVRIKLPDGSDYPHLGKIDFVDSQVDRNTDTVLVRATLANPVKRQGTGNERDLIDGAIVTVRLEGKEPEMVVTIPRSALLVDQQGPYVFVVDKESRGQVRRVRLGQGTAEFIAVESGLEPGETVVVEGIQRIRPGQPVQAAPVTPVVRQERLPR